MFVMHVLAALFCAAWVGCVHLPADPEYAGPKPLPERLQREYFHPGFRGGCDERMGETTGRYTVKRIEFESANNHVVPKQRIRIDYYQVNRDGKSPVIMVLPILGGGNRVAKRFAAYYARHGFAAVIVNRQEGYKKIKRIDGINPTLKQIVCDHKQTIDWAETRPELDAERIGVFGVSMGGIKGALIIALDRRIKAGVMALAGGDIPYILTHSNEKGIIRRRNEYMEKHGLTRKGFYRKLKGEITCDPMVFAEYIDARNVMMVLARFDRTVPYQKGRMLWEKIGRPEVIYLLSGHYTALPFISYVKSESLRFFRRKLGIPE